MSFFRTISHLFESIFGTSSTNDPNGSLKSYLREMQEKLRDAKLGVSQAIRERKRLEQQREEVLKRARDWEEKAELALDKGNEELARKALKQKQESESLAIDFEAELATQEKTVEVIKSSVAALERKIEEAERRKALLDARERRAKAEREMQEKIAGLGGESLSSTFERMEERVINLEAEAEAARQLAVMEDAEEASLPAVSNHDPAVDAELAALRAKMSEKKKADPFHQMLTETQRVMDEASARDDEDDGGIKKEQLPE